MTNGLFFSQSEPTLMLGREVGDSVKRGMCWEMVNIHPNKIGIA